MKKMGYVGKLLTSSVVGLIFGGLDGAFGLFPEVVHGFDVGGIVAFAGIGFGGFWIYYETDKEETKKRQEKLDWFINNGNQKVASVREEITRRAFRKSYESMAQRNSDIARLGELLDDKNLGLWLIEHMEKEGSVFFAGQKERQGEMVSDKEVDSVCIDELKKEGSLPW
jgi:hypothetical protein